MNIRNTLTIAGATLAVLTVTALPASAGTETTVTADAITEKVAKSVSFADLDLTSPEAQEILYNRLSLAAEQVCGPSSIRQAGSLAQAARNRDCYEDSLSRALSQVSTAAGMAAAN